MPLQRSASMKTTLSTVIRRTSKYQYFLSIFNVLILLASLTILFFGLALKMSFKMDSFDFVDSNFKLVPYLLIAIGSLMFVVSAVSFIGFGTDVKTPYYLIATLMSIFSLAMLGKCLKNNFYTSQNYSSRRGRPHIYFGKF